MEQIEIDKILKENNLTKDRYNLIRNKNIIIDLSEKQGNILNRTSIINILNILKNDHGVKKNIGIGTFKHYVVNILGLFKEVNILSNDMIKTTRYIATYVQISPYEIALSLLSKSFLSHYSAMYIHDLTINNPKTIYINHEQTIKPKNNDNAVLTQKKIDYAFSKEMRMANPKFGFVYQDTHYKVVVLNSKNTNNTGVVSIKPLEFSKKIRVTNIERTLIDATVRPKYCGGAEEVLEAYNLSNERVDIDKLITYLKKFDYVYPYEKSIGLYIRKSKYDSKIFKYFIDNFKVELEKYSDISFYVDYQIVGKVLNKELNIYYPKSLDNIFRMYSKEPQSGIIYLADLPDYMEGMYQIDRVELFDKKGKFIGEFNELSLIEFSNIKDLENKVLETYGIQEIDFI